MLDALLAEARLRWGLDPAAGLAVCVAERVIATPIEPTVATLIVPASRLKATADGGTALPLPGRHGSRGRDALDVLRGSTPRTTRSAASARSRGRRSGS